MRRRRQPARDGFACRGARRRAGRSSWSSSHGHGAPHADELIMSRVRVASLDWDAKHGCLALHRLPAWPPDDLHTASRSPPSQLFLRWLRHGPRVKPRVPSVRALCSTVPTVVSVWSRARNPCDDLDLGSDGPTSRNRREFVILLLAWKETKTGHGGGNERARKTAR